MPVVAVTDPRDVEACVQRMCLVLVFYEVVGVDRWISRPIELPKVLEILNRYKVISTARPNTPTQLLLATLVIEEGDVSFSKVSNFKGGLSDDENDSEANTGAATPPPGSSGPQRTPAHRRKSTLPPGVIPTW